MVEGNGSLGGRGEFGRRVRGEVERIGRVNNSKVELRWVGGLVVVVAATMIFDCVNNQFFTFSFRPSFNRGDEDQSCEHLQHHC